MHSKMTEKVLRAKILFFDSNPIGRVLARFSKDLSVFDMLIPVLTVFVIQGIFRAISVSITVMIIDPYIIIAVAVCVTLMCFIYIIGKPAMIDS